MFLSFYWSNIYDISIYFSVNIVVHATIYLFIYLFIYLNFDMYNQVKPDSSHFSVSWHFMMQLWCKYNEYM